MCTTNNNFCRSIKTLSLREKSTLNKINDQFALYVYKFVYKNVFKASKFPI